MMVPGRTRTTRGTTWGGFAFASLAVAAVSGIALALPFDVRKPYDSIAWLLLTNPAARFYRSVHYLSAQLFLVLSVLHAWEHLGRSTERRLSAGMWARVTLSIPIAVFLMLSGFILRGDGEAGQALRIVTAAIGQIPLAGRLLPVLLFGPSPDNLQLVYVHHVATATIFTWLFTAEHARRVWPRALPLVLVSFAVGAASLFIMPGLHDGLDPIVKGPWYLLGLQELLHWASTPTWVMAAGVCALLAVLVLPRLSEDRGRRVKQALAACLAGYVAVTAFALLFRADNWSLAWPDRAFAPGIRLESPLAAPDASVVRMREIPVVLGRREGCLFCHNAMRGLSASHRADAVGCASCHAGNPFSLDKALAHRRMILVPGNLDAAARTCGLSACHPAIVGRVRRSVMTTMAGVVSVDRVVFGESAGGHVDALGHSPAETHLRQLCASCHLANPKTDAGAIDETSRGGGCNACHLKYTAEARANLERYARSRQTGSAALAVHPDLSIDIGDDHCFGCHSRSGRISTSYEGWMERSATGGRMERVRTLADGRVFDFVAPDVHFAKGMRCVDCHTAREAMGDGANHARKHEQIKIACEDCHVPGEPATASASTVDAEARRILTLRGGPRPGLRVLTTRSGGEPLLNTGFDAEGRLQMTAKGTNAVLPLARPSASCLQVGGHARLSCISCHTAWAPQCAGCHTRFNAGATAYDHLAGREVKGAWVEEGSDYRAGPPALGVRTVTPGGSQARETVDPFIPGMVLTVDRGTGAGRPDTAFRRLFARAFPHTISKGSRSCESCHNDPVALGYGRGRLVFERTPNGARWTFTPEHQPSAYDRLPEDAWIGFLQTRGGIVSSRDDVRPFTVDEQKRILTVGACLTCHPASSAVMRDAVRDFPALVRRAGKRCAIPVWN